LHKSRNRRTGGDLTLPTVEELLREQNETDFYEEEQFTSVPGYQTSEYKDSQIIIISNKEIGNLDQQISVSGESNSQYIMFEVNRFEDNIDLIDKLIQVHYEREDGVGDNCPVVDVSASNLHMRFGWVIPPKAVEIDGILKIMPFIHGTTSSGNTYILKEIYAEYDVKEGLALSGGIEKPEEDWYVQFLNKMDNYVSDVKKLEYSAKTSASNASDSKQAAAASESKAQEYSDSAKTSASNASDSKQAAAASESKAQEYSDSAKTYYEKTKTLSILNVGEMEFSINESKKCLSITYTQEGEENAYN
jgi:hypothetical protein